MSTTAPTFKRSAEKDPAAIAERYAEVMAHYNRRSPNYEGSQDMTAFKVYMEERIRKGDALQMVVPFCSFKLSNEKHTFNEGADAAEEHAIRNIAQFCREAGEIWPTKFILCHDAEIAHHLGLTPPMDVMDKYKADIGAMIKNEGPIPNAEIIQLNIKDMMEDLFPDMPFGEGMINHAARVLGAPTIETYKARAEANEGNFADVHCRNKKWLQENIPNIHIDPKQPDIVLSKHKVRVRISDIAYRKEQCVEVFRLVVESALPGDRYMRLSPHVKEHNDGKKFAFEFFPQRRDIVGGRMPWTGVYVEYENGECDVISRTDAEEHGLVANATPTGSRLYVEPTKLAAGADFRSRFDQQPHHNISA
jgi:pyoverdine/dityrosine biosynthesis protein Dit1